MFSVGLKEFWSAIGDDQSVTETGQVNLQKIPKINSVVGILDHLASADHTQEVKECLKTMVCDSIQQYDDEDIEAGSEEEEQSLATLGRAIGGAVFCDIGSKGGTRGTAAGGVHKLCYFRSGRRE